VRRPLTLIYACFDPYHAAHAKRLASLRTAAGPEATLAVCIDDNPVRPALLPRRARAEMAAALHSVDYVLTAEPPPSLVPDNVVDLRSEDAELTAALRRRVHARQAAAGTQKPE
jgi:hypothetical protein